MTDAVTNGSPRFADRPWVDYLQEPQVDQTEGGLVRLVARNAPGTPITLVLDALRTPDLPGVPG